MKASLRVSPKHSGQITAVVNALCSDEKRRLITATGMASYAPFRVPGIVQIRMKTVSGFVVSSINDEREVDYIFIQNHSGKNATLLPSSDNTLRCRSKFSIEYMAAFEEWGVKDVLSIEYTAAFEEWSVKEVLSGFPNIGNTFERDAITGLMYSVDESSGIYNDLWACDESRPYDNNTLYYRIA